MAIKKKIDVEAKTVTFTFEDDSTQVLELGNLTPEMQTQLALHGLSQKAGDSYAG